MRFYILLFLACLATTVSGQAKKPKIMVIPSDQWCIDKGYFSSFDNQGSETRVPDYTAAFQSDADLKLVISKINTLMAERGFPLADMEATLKKIAKDKAENMVTTSKQGSTIAETPLEVIRRQASPDITMELTYKINKQGPKKSISFILRGLDAYTSEQVAGAEGTGAPSFSAEVPVLLEEAVLAHIDNFNTLLQSYFDDLFTNGRKVTISIKRFDNGSETDLETEFDGQELSEIIEEWFAANTVSGRFNTTEASENIMVLDQVRIPMTDEKGIAMDTRKFAGQLRKFLKGAPYNIESKLLLKGLGEAHLILGEKQP